jgi:dimethylargininase
VLDPTKIKAAAFDGLEVIEVHPEESSAANVLQLADVTVVPAECARTRDRLEQRGIATCEIDMSELAKAEGALTCGSILFEA